MKVAVTGAAGYLGLNVATALLERGHDVIAIDRVAGSMPAGTHGAGRLQWALADALDEEAMSKAIDSAEVLFHLVAVISLRQEDPTAERVNTEGVAVAARSALRVGVRRMVNCGSLASFHYGGHGLITESSPRSTDPRLPVYHRSKYAGEVALAAVIDAGLDALTCHPTGIFGPLDHPTRLSRMNVGLLSAARGRLPASVGGAFDMVDARDVAQGFLLAAEHGRTGHNYLLGGHRFDLFEAQVMAARLAGAHPPRLKIPFRVLERMAPMIDPAARRFGSDSFAPSALENISRAPHVDHTKAETELGYTPRPTEATLRDLVGFFSANRLLGSRRRQGLAQTDC